MDDHKKAFLVAIAALAPDVSADADIVNRLGRIWGIDPPVIATMVEALKADGLIDLHWGPALSLTEKGQRLAAGEPAAPQSSVVVQAGGTFVGGSVGNNANIGPGAGAKQSAVIVGSTVNGAVVVGVPAGLLAAALVQLQQSKSALPEAAQAPAADLEQTLEKSAAATTLDQVGEGLKRSTELLGQVEQAGGKLANVGGMLQQAWDFVSPHLPTLGS